METIYSAEEIEEEKVAGIDINGTTVKRNGTKSTMHEINTALGLPPGVDESIYLENRAHRGNIENYLEHGSDITRALETEEKEYLEESDITRYYNKAQELCQDREIVEGAREFINSLEESGYHTVAVSSAPKAVSKPLADDIGFSSFYVFREVLFDEQGQFAGVYVDPDCSTGKEEFVKQLKDQGSTVFYAGNGGNDVNAIENADIGEKRHDWISNSEAFNEVLEKIT